MSEKPRFNEWVRDPKGKRLVEPFPVGKRCPNGIIWGHTFKDFFRIQWIPDGPDLNAKTVWSRSMIQEFGENYADEEHEPEPDPHRMCPWPVLKLPLVSLHIDSVDEAKGGKGISSPTLSNKAVCEVPEHIKATQPNMIDVTPAEKVAPARIYDLSAPPADYQAELLADKQPPLTVENADRSTVMDAQEEYRSQDDDAKGVDETIDTQGSTLSCSDTALQSGGPTEPSAVPRANADNADPISNGINMTMDPTVNLGAACTAVSHAQDPKIESPLLSTPKLEEYIPKEFFPDILLVNDPDNATQPREGFAWHNLRTQASVERVPRKYERVWPKFARDDEPVAAFNLDPSCSLISSPSPITTLPNKTPQPRVAHLNLSAAPLLGKGNHSCVHRASLRLPPPLTARSPTREVSVAAKMAFLSGKARELLENEARIYDAFPAHLMEGWCGLNLVEPIPDPVPVGAVVPKFYGYYVPVREKREGKKKLKAENKESERQHERRRQAEEINFKEGEENTNESVQRDDVVISPLLKDLADGAVENEGNEDNGEDEDEDEDEDGDGDGNEDEDEDEDEDNDAYPPSPILLLEECGHPIVPSRLSPDQKSECYSLLLRLHKAQFLQNSLYTRNILIQPGPLTAHPSHRSHKTPSFRIIDFGRGEFLEYYKDRELPSWRADVDREWEEKEEGLDGELQIAEETLKKWDEVLKDSEKLVKLKVAGEGKEGDWEGKAGEVCGEEMEQYQKAKEAVKKLQRQREEDAKRRMADISQARLGWLKQWVANRWRDMVTYEERKAQAALQIDCNYPVLTPDA